MNRVDVQEAKDNFAELLRMVSNGDRVIITRSGKPIAKIVPIESAQKRQFGVDAGRFEVPADFDESLDEAILAGFENPDLEATP